MSMQFKVVHAQTTPTSLAPILQYKRHSTYTEGRYGAATDTQAPEIVNEVIRSPGRSLEGATQQFFSQRLGHDFGRIRVHTDRKAATSARAVNALAYTVGQHIVFGEGQYAPATEAGQYLLAHELAHAIQQERFSDTDVADKEGLLVNSPRDAYEREADVYAVNALCSAVSPRASARPSRAIVQPALAAAAPLVARVNCATVPQSLCKGIYSCGYGGSGKCYWGGTYPDKRCMCFGASRPDVSTSKVLEVLLIIGLSIALLATVVAALLDPEPVSKLGLAGLTAAEIVALLLLLGYSREEVRDMGLDPDLVAQVDLGEGRGGEEAGTRVA